MGKIIVIYCNSQRDAAEIMTSRRREGAHWPLRRVACQLEAITRVALCPPPDACEAREKSSVLAPPILAFLRGSSSQSPTVAPPVSLVLLTRGKKPMKPE
ncbi:hypothetical protein PoB_006604200 [Plakobranchus ocellatus]|uniref:Uncharacterized protein n=1 Tax=Plakobranchus ocellatus TaxID=259542 RepID=A0AAV4D5W6_9GAST|nr:hypothetical protein PoB_006604200 [Plakobranchus ocellatus]